MADNSIHSCFSLPCGFFMCLSFVSPNNCYLVLQIQTLQWRESDWFIMFTHSLIRQKCSSSYLTALAALRQIFFPGEPAALRVAMSHGRDHGNPGRRGHLGLLLWQEALSGTKLCCCLMKALRVLRQWAHKRGESSCQLVGLNPIL